VEKSLIAASGRSWSMLSLSLLAIVIMFISYIGYSISSLDIMAELGLNYTQIGSLASMSALTGGISVLFAWIFINKYGAKRISIFALLTCAVGLLIFSYAQSYETLLFSRALQGVGIAVCFNSPYSFATNWFENTKNLAACTGLLMAADGIGTFTTLYLYTFIIQAFGWRLGAIVGAVIVLACAVIFALVAREAPSVTYGLKTEIGLLRKYIATIKNRMSFLLACLLPDCGARMELQCIGFLPC
jgi:MFS family permease